MLLLAGLLVAGLAFAVGRFTVYPALTSANPIPVPNAADAGFARDMQTHHAQAVEMAMIEYRGTSDEELRMIAYDIATAQAGQRGEMYSWLVQWALPQAGGPVMSWMNVGEHAHDAGLSEDELRAEMGMATPEEITELEQSTGAAQDCTFLSLMIRHHEGAIEMTDAVLELGSIERVLETAESMANVQRVEIDALTSAQQRLGCTGS